MSHRSPGAIITERICFNCSMGRQKSGQALYRNELIKDVKQIK